MLGTQNRFVEFPYHNGASTDLRRAQHIMDERYLVIDIEGKGLVIFSA